MMKHDVTMTNSVALFGEVLADVFPDRAVLGGAPFNVARHLQCFGLAPFLITRTGYDALRQELLAEMKRLGMEISGVQRDASYPTGQVMVHMETNGHRFEILPEQAYDHIHPEEILAAPAYQVIYFGTLAQRCLQSRFALDVFLANSRGLRFLDINLRTPWYDLDTIQRSMLLADILKINDEELATVAGLLKLPGTPREQATALIEEFDLQSVLVTCGAGGAWLLDKEGHEIRVDGAPVAALSDTVGAGDGFASVFLLGLLKGWPQDVTLRRANEFAATICAIRGAAPEEDDFYAPFLREWNRES